MTTRNRKTEMCECGCGKKTQRRVALLREQDLGTVEALRWQETSIAPMRVLVALMRGHWIKGYLNENPAVISRAAKKMLVERC